MERCWFQREDLYKDIPRLWNTTSAVMIAGYSRLYINIMPGNYPYFKEETSLQNEEALNARNKCVDINSLAFPRIVECPHSLERWADKWINKWVKIKDCFFYAWLNSQKYFSTSNSVSSLLSAPTPWACQWGQSQEHHEPIQSIFPPYHLCNSPAVWSHLTSYREKINHQLMRWGCEKCERSNLEAPIRVYSCGPPVSITGWSQVQRGEKGMQDDSRSGGGQEKREEGKRSSWADKEAFPALPMRADAGLNSHGESKMV